VQLICLLRERNADRGRKKTRARKGFGACSSPAHGCERVVEPRRTASSPVRAHAHAKVEEDYFDGLEDISPLIAAFDDSASEVTVHLLFILMVSCPECSCPQGSD
jgi:hypothetical protein